MCNQSFEAPAMSGPPEVKHSGWWTENCEAVEAKFIGMLMAETTRKPYFGPERRSRATVVLDPADLAVAQLQATRMGVRCEDHVRRLFHQAVMTEEDGHLI